MSSIKNYTEQGGDRTIIKGELEIIDGGKLKINGQEISSTSSGGSGGIMLSPIAYQADCTASNVAGIRSDFNDLLQAMRDAGLMATDVPIITIINQPTDISVIEGNISSTITVEAKASDGREVEFKWYSSENETNENGELIVSETTNTFKIPSDLTEGQYYYYCEVSAEDVKTVKSSVITVKVSVS